MKLSIIIPVYNEINTIEKVLKKIIALDIAIEKEIIIVDDGSTDGTTDIIQREMKENQPIVKVFVSPINFGKGAAVRIGLKYVTGDIVLIQDADLELDPHEYPALLSPILDGETIVVYGTRFKKTKWVKGMRFPNVIANIILTLTANLLYGAHITDVSTAYKVFKTDVIKGINLKSTRFEFCHEVTAKLCRKGYKIFEVPISYYPRKKSEGVKISWQVGFTAMWTLIKYRFIT